MSAYFSEACQQPTHTQGLRYPSRGTFAVVFIVQVYSLYFDLAFSPFLILHFSIFFKDKKIMTSSWRKKKKEDVENFVGSLGGPRVP